MWCGTPRRNSVQYIRYIVPQPLCFQSHMEVLLCNGNVHLWYFIWNMCFSLRSNVSPHYPKSCLPDENLRTGFTIHLSTRTKPVRIVYIYYCDISNIQRGSTVKLESIIVSSAANCIINCLVKCLISHTICCRGITAAEKCFMKVSYSIKDYQLHV